MVCSQEPLFILPFLAPVLFTVSTSRTLLHACMLFLQQTVNVQRVSWLQQREVVVSIFLHLLVVWVHSGLLYLRGLLPHLKIHFQSLVLMYLYLVVFLVCVKPVNGISNYSIKCNKHRETCFSWDCSVKHYKLSKSSSATSILYTASNPPFYSFLQCSAVYHVSGTYIREWCPSPYWCLLAPRTIKEGPVFAMPPEFLISVLLLKCYFFHEIFWQIPNRSQVK